MDSTYHSNKIKAYRLYLRSFSRSRQSLHERRKVGWLTSHGTPLLDSHSWSPSAISTCSLIRRLFLSVSSFPSSYGIHRTIARDQLTLLPTSRNAQLSHKRNLAQVCPISRLYRLKMYTRRSQCISHVSFSLCPLRVIYTYSCLAFQFSYLLLGCHSIKVITLLSYSTFTWN